jgi:hypothetical protein
MHDHVTVGILVYKSTNWLDFALMGLDAARNDTTYDLIIVANDATDEVKADRRVTHTFENNDPDEFFIRRVYRAWNYLVSVVPTEKVVLMNTDMYVSDGWLDERVKASVRYEKVLPTSMLVESGRTQSKCPQWVKNFGTNPAEFLLNVETWEQHAKLVARPGMYGKGELYMPVLLDKAKFLKMGGYPTDQKSWQEDPYVMPGDQVFFNRWAAMGYIHVTAYGSVVYHVQEGEMKS